MDFVPSQEELDNLKVHVEFYSVKGEWVRTDTLYDYDSAYRICFNATDGGGTAYKIVNDKGEILELFPLEDTN